jgi:hypothetical protein
VVEGGAAEVSDGHHPMCSKLRRMPECDCWARAAVGRLAHELGGYGAANQAEILRGDYSHVSDEDVPLFVEAVTASRAR